MSLTGPSPSGWTRWPNQLFGTDIGPHEKLVFIALLAYRYNPGDEVIPSQGTIAHMTGLSTRTVMRAIRNLIDGGWIESRQRGGAGAGRISNAYSLESGLKRLAATSATQSLSPYDSQAPSPQGPLPHSHSASDPQSQEEDVKTKENFSDEAKQLCGHLAELAKLQNPDHRINSRGAWLRDMQQLLDEGHSPHRVKELIDSAFADQDFWAARIPAPAALLKSWNTLTSQFPHVQTTAERVAAYEATRQGQT